MEQDEQMTLACSSGSFEEEDRSGRITPAIDHDTASINVKDRVKEISGKLNGLFEDYPEMKYMSLQTRDLQTEIEAAIEKYRDEARNMRNTLLYSLPDEKLLKCLSFVGKGRYGLVAPASKKLAL